MTNFLKAVALTGATLIATSSVAHAATHKHRASATDAKTTELNRQQLAAMDNGTTGAANAAPAANAPVDSAPAPMAAPADAGPATTTPASNTTAPQPPQ